MKTKTILLTVLFFSVMFFSTTATLAQDEPIAGGYIKASVKDKEVISAVRFAVKKQSQRQRATISLISIKKAKKQVVAGMNYEVCFLVKSQKNSTSKAKNQLIKAVVYRNLRNVFSLTSWKVQNSANCGN